MKNPKKIVTLLFVALISVAATACNSPTSPSPENTPGDAASATTSSNPQTENTSPPTSGASASTAETPNPAENKTPAGDDAIRLRLRLEQSQTFHMQTTTVQTINQNMFGQSVDAVETSKNQMRYDVAGVDESGNITLNIVFENVYRRREGPAGISEFDSSKADMDTPEAQVFGALVGQSFQMTLAPNGEVLSVVGMKEMMTKLVDQLGAGENSAVIKTVFESMFSDSAMKETMQTAFVVFSQNPLSVGETWEDQIITTSGLPFNIKNQWTITDRANGIVFVDMNSVMTTNPDAPAVELGPLSYSYPLMEGTAEGTLEIDEQTGWVVKSHVTQTFNGEMKMEGVGAALGDEPIPISGQIEITIEQTEAP